MEKQVIFSKSVELFLKDVLYEENYFGFEDDAKLYVTEIILYIMHHDFKTNVRNTSLSLRKFGKKFIKYKANNNTSWYIFFDQKDQKFLINHIINNHSQDFPELF